MCQISKAPIQVLLLLSSICLSFQFNIENDASSVSIFKAKGKTAATINDTYFYGYTLRLDKMGLAIGAPSFSSTDLQRDPAYIKRHGSITLCDDYFIEPICRDTYPVPPSNNDAFGSSIAQFPNGDYVACSPSKEQQCFTSNSVPGYCFKKGSNSSSWTSDTRSSELECSNPYMDVLFVLDGSASVNSTNFLVVKDWVKEVSSAISSFDGSGKTRIGVIQYSHYYDSKPVENQKYMKTEIPLDVYTEEQFNSKVETIQLQGYTTYTAHALNKSFQDFTDASPRNSTQVVLLVTDGRSSDKDELPATSEYVRSSGINIFAVGVGDANKEELGIIANGSPDSSDRVFYVGNFEKLTSLVQTLKKEIAKVALEGSDKNSNKANIKMELAQIGSSASNTVSRTGALYLGAVGAYDWSGCVIKYDSVDDDTPDIPLFVDVQGVLPGKTKGSYLGYSVTSGYFQGGNIEYVASGAPRHNLNGSVVVYRPRPNSVKFHDAVTISGPASEKARLHGSYFGGSVLSMDLNNDKIDDLLVGAPLYISKEGLYDEGRVFVYIGTGSTSLQTWAGAGYEPSALTGTNLPGGRFGTAIADAGDMNNDGYRDVIVGAPLAGNGAGAVFVYHGSSTGINTKVKQVILASDITGVSLKYFGQSLQGGVDLDANSYPDMAVGAPKSDMVLIFRSKPVVKVEATKVKFTSSTINILQCMEKENRDCVKLEVCFKSSGKNIEPTIGLQYNITLDSEIIADSAKRIEFRSQPNNTITGTTTKTNTITLTSNAAAVCETYQIYVKNNLLDYDTELKALVKFDLLSAHVNKPMASVRDPDDITTKFDTMKFTKDCGANGCEYDLSLTGSMDIPALPVSANGQDLSENKRVLVVTPETAKNAIVVTGNLSNNGDHAFDTYLNITFSAHIGFTKMQITGSSRAGYFGCFEEDAGAAVTTNTTKTRVYRYKHNSAIGSIMLNHAHCSFQISFHIGNNLVKSGDHKDFYVKLVAGTRDTSSSSKELKPNDNTWQDTRNIKYRSDLTLKKRADALAIPFNYTDELKNITSVKEIGLNTSDVEMKFEIRGEGYSTIPRTDATLKFPYKTVYGNRLLYLYNVTCEGVASCICNMSTVNVYNLTQDAPNENNTHGSSLVVTPSTAAIDEEVYDCSGKESINHECAHVSCTVFNLGTSDEALFTARFRLWTQDMNFNASNMTEFSMRSLFTISTIRSPYIINMDGSNVTTKSEEFLVKAQKYKTPEQYTNPNNLWIYILAAIGGLLLLVALSLILYKAGFFKSKYAEMKKDAQGMEDDFDTGPNGDNASTADMVN